MGCAKGIGGQLLGLPDDRYRVTEIIQRLHAVHVHTHALLAQKGRQLRVAAAPLVSGHIKGHHPHLPEPLQRLVNGGAVLVELLFFVHPFHLFFTTRHTKNTGRLNSAKTVLLTREGSSQCSPAQSAPNFPAHCAGNRSRLLRQDIEMKFCQSLYSTYYFYYSY